MGFSKQEYWSGLPCPPPGDLPDAGIEAALQADSLPAEPSGLQVEDGYPYAVGQGLSSGGGSFIR